MTKNNHPEAIPKVEKLLFTDPDWRSKTQLQFDIPSFYYANAKPEYINSGKMLYQQHGLRNFSRLDNSLGDRRLSYEQSLSQEVFHPSLKKEEEDGDELSEMRKSQHRRRDYEYALSVVSGPEIEDMHTSMKHKLGQRSNTGTFKLKSTFKHFDRNGSGDIDIDETRHAFNLLGLNGFTETQITAFFASRDVELQGALSYKSFIDRLTESDFMCTGPSWLRQPLQKCRRPLEGASTRPDKAAEAKELREEQDELRGVWALLTQQGGTLHLDLYGLMALLMVLGSSPDKAALRRLAEQVMTFSDTHSKSDETGEGEGKGEGSGVGFDVFWQWWLQQKQEGRSILRRPSALNAMKQRS